MRHSFILTALAAALIVSCNHVVESVDYIDPFIGTGFHGHTYPGATTPFGAVQLSPDNYREVWDASSGYHYDRDSIIGFSHTHLSGTGCVDFGDILFHPTNHDVDLSREGDIFEHLKYSHKDEEASAGYYSVYFRDERLKAELTATPHTGWHRYTFCKGMPHNIVIDMGHVISVSGEIIKEVEIKQTAPDEIVGMRVSSAWVPNQHIYFVAQFSREIETVRYVDDHKFIDSPEQFESKNRQAVLTFSDGQGPVVAKVGISSVSYEGARYNLDVEGGAFAFNFDAVRKEARDMWKNLADNIRVEGGTERQKRIFYTALYHTAVVPNNTSDFNGIYRRNNDQIAMCRFGKMYSTLSLWDTFRAWLPLSSLIYPRQLHDIVFSCLDMYQASGMLPLWPLASGETECMIGYHSIPFIVDAWFKGLVPELDVDYALNAMTVSSDINAKGSSYYTRLGYIPANKLRENVSCALEYAYDDWCIARFAEAIGRTDVAETYYKRAHNYINVFDGSTGFFRGRNLDGSMVDPFDPFEPSREYTEANAWQYRFFTPQDFRSMCHLLGGEDKFIEALDGLFSASSEINGHVSDMTGMVGQYVHGNEPSHHIIYIYNWLGQSWKTQELTRRMLEEMYDDTPEGISGNEDCGQMSAWYIMSALGLYEVCPGSAEFTFTSPLFDKASMFLPNGRELCITADDPARNKYIQSVEFNGRVLDKAYITYEELLDGGELHFTLGRKPNKSLWAAPEARPYSMTKDETLVSPVYYTLEGGRIDLFLEKLTMTLGTLTEGAEIRYTLDGSEPTRESALYSAPISIEETSTIRAKAFKGDNESIEFCTTPQKCHFIPGVAGDFTEHGVNYKYYTGDFRCTDDIARIGTFVKEGKIESPVLDPADQEDYYGFIYTGYLDIPETKVWSFALYCDDGGLLQIDGKDVVDNDGTHSATMMKGFIPLEAGRHPFTLKYLESYEGQVLKVLWEKDGEFRDIPADAYFIR
ncbi:MAG: glycoside hydrolase family 92 protein [Bacteroidales bacterium]|nr:glycoside hydrolase family 92 protein [Bacteroidales bacterium]